VLFVLLAIFDLVVEVFWGTLNSHPKLFLIERPMSSSGRGLILWGLIPGLLAQAIFDASRVLVGEYVRSLSTYENILVAVAIPIAVLYYFLRRERGEGAEVNNQSPPLGTLTPKGLERNPQTRRSRSGLRPRDWGRRQGLTNSADHRHLTRVDLCPPEFIVDRESPQLGVLGEQSPNPIVLKGEGRAFCRIQSGLATAQFQRRVKWLALLAEAYQSS